MAETWNITRTNGSEIYVEHDGQFVARFKYKNKGRTATKFIDFLKKNFTPAEYFEARGRGMPPSVILETKGYVPYNIELARKAGLIN